MTPLKYLRAALKRLFARALDDISEHEIFTVYVTAWAYEMKLEHEDVLSPHDLMEKADRALSNIQDMLDELGSQIVTYSYNTLQERIELMERNSAKALAKIREAKKGPNIAKHVGNVLDGFRNEFEEATEKHLHETVDASLRAINKILARTGFGVLAELDAGEALPTKADHLRLLITKLAERFENSHSYTQGTVRIAQERLRQIYNEGYSDEDDDAHDQGELAWAAIHYAAPEPLTHLDLPDRWPENWPDKRPRTLKGELCAPSPVERIRLLEKAGALIAAELDRLLRARDCENDLAVKLAVK